MGKEKSTEQVKIKLKRLLALSSHPTEIKLNELNKELKRIFSDPEFKKNPSIATLVTLAKKRELLNKGEARSLEKELEKVAIIGAKSAKGASEGGKRRKAVHNSFWLLEVQPRAEAIWKKNPSLSNKQMANILREKCPNLLKRLSAETIRKRITKPT